MMRNLGQNIVSLEHFHVDFFPSRVFTGKLLFTFTPIGNRSLTGDGFGGRFAVENGFDLIAIKSDIEDWYKSLPRGTFDQIEQFLADMPFRQHTLRAAYGSSMGAYAAIIFASRMKADVILALSPQFDIGGRWDRRWAAHSAQIGTLQTLTDEDVRPRCRYFIAYDPLNPDRMHFDRFAQIVPPAVLHPIKVPYGGHPVGFLLQSIGCLKETASVVLSGLTAPVLVHKRRARRARYPIYLLNLSRNCQVNNKQRWARSLINKAIDLAPLNSEIRIRAAQIAEAAGDLDEAITHAAIAVAMTPNQPYMAATLSRLFQKKGYLSQALHYIDAALAIVPKEQSLIDQKAGVLIRMEAVRARQKHDR